MSWKNITLIPGGYLPAKKSRSKSKFKLPFLAPKTIGLVIAGLIIASICAGLVYAKWSKSSLAVIVGGNRAGVWFDPETGSPSVQTGKFGCCLPTCSDAFELECEQLAEGIQSASFNPGVCKNLEECQPGCCEVDCQVRQLPKSACTHIGGAWSSSCDIGCCQTEFSESEVPESICNSCVTDSTWYPGACLPGYSVVVKGGESGQVDFSDDWGGDAMGQGLNAFLDMAGGDRRQSISYEYDLYSCGDTPYGLWSGTKKTITFSGESGETKTKEEDTEFTISSEGSEIKGSLFEGGLAAFSASRRIEGNQMIMDFKMPLIGDIHATGTIHSGAQQCRWKLKK